MVIVFAVSTDLKGFEHLVILGFDCGHFLVLDHLPSRGLVLAARPLVKTRDLADAVAFYG